MPIDEIEENLIQTQQATKRLWDAMCLDLGKRINWELTRTIGYGENREPLSGPSDK